MGFQLWNEITSFCCCVFALAGAGAPASEDEDDPSPAPQELAGTNKDSAASEPGEWVLLRNTFCWLDWDVSPT